MQIPAFSSASWGMSAASQRFDGAAGKIATASTPDPTDMVEATMLAPAAYTANATVLRVAAETQQSLIDIRA
jgi:flagellar basal body rod protein FlgC